MERAITGSVSPSAALDPVALPSASRSKRGASIAGIPSFGGPPDLIPANGTLCLEKSVRGHSNRQLIGSADKAPRLASTRPKTAVSAINLGKLPTNDAIAISRHLSVDPQSCPRSVRLDRFGVHLLERLTHFRECVVASIDRIFRPENLRLDIGQPHLPAVILPREHLHRQFDADPSIRLHQRGTQLWVSEYQELGGLECLADFLCGCRMVNSSCNSDASCLERVG